MRYSMLLVSLIGCSQGLGYNKSGDDSATNAPDDTQGDSTPMDTADTDGDLDDDGYTPEEGDCDDDNVRVSPARPEDTNDGLDNDCDGRIDEEWTGLDIAYANESGASEIVTIDRLGREQDFVRVSDSCYPVWLDHAAGPLSDGTDGWVINNGYAKVSIVDRDGTCTDLFDFTEDAEAYPFGLYGIATGIDGTIYATTLDALQRIDTDGTVTTVASWSCNFDDPTAHEIAVYSLAVDPQTGTIGLFGYFGGFATYNPTDGVFSLEASEDLESPEVSTYSGAHKDGGGWYSPGIDGATGAYGIYRYDLDSSAWEQKEEWADEDWVPFMLAIDGDSGDYYVTANAGWYYTVWAILSGSGYAADLYTTDGSEPNRGFYGLVTNY